MPSQTIRIGLACNEGCLYCFADPERWADRPRGWGRDYANLIGDDWRTELREIRAAGYDGLSISGGEPTLHPDLVKMVRYARLLGFERVELQSNATLLTPANARRLAKAGVCSALISLPSHIEKVYNAITATRDYFQPALDGVRNLTDQGVIVRLAHVQCTANYRHTPEYVEFVAEHFPDISGVAFLYVQPEGRALGYPALYPDLSDLKPHFERALEACTRLGVRFTTDVQTGVPMCMMGGYEDRVDRSLLLSPRDFWAEDLTSYEYMQAHKRQGPRCGECFWTRVCYGFWNEYLDAYGDAALEPVLSTPRLRELFPEVEGGVEVPGLPTPSKVSTPRLQVRPVAEVGLNKPAAPAQTASAERAARTA